MQSATASNASAASRPPSRPTTARPPSSTPPSKPPTTQTHAYSAAAVHGSSVGADSRLHAHWAQARLSTSQLVDALHTCLHQAAAGAGASHAFVRGFVDHLSTFRLRRMKPGQLATVIHSLAALEYHPGEDWLADFDMTCFSHVGPLDADSVTRVLQAMAYKFPPSGEETYRFPQAVYLKLKAHTEDFSFEQLATILRCLQAMQFSMEDEVLEQVGKRMATLMQEMEGPERDQAIQRLLAEQQ